MQQVCIFQPRPLCGIIPDHPYDDGCYRHQNMVSAGFRPITRGPSLLIIGIGLSFYMNPRLAFVFLVCTPLLGFILSPWIVRRVAPMYTKLQSMVDRLNNVVQEGLTAIRAVKAFVRDEYEEDKFNEVNTDLTAASEQTFHYAVLNLPAFQGVMYTAIVLILWFGGNMILKKQLAVGNLTGFLSYVIAGHELDDDDCKRIPALDPFHGERTPDCRGAR